LDHLEGTPLVRFGVAVAPAVAGVAFGVEGYGSPRGRPADEVAEGFGLWEPVACVFV